MNTNKTMEIQNQTERENAQMVYLALWQKASEGARRYELVFTYDGTPLPPIGGRVKGLAYDYMYAVRVEENKHYWIVFLKLTNVKTGPRGMRQNKYGWIELVRFLPSERLAERFDADWWNRELHNYYVAKVEPIDTAWVVNPWDGADFNEAWQDVPQHLKELAERFMHQVVYSGDLDVLIKKYRKI